MSEETKDSWTGCGLKGCMLWGCVSILLIGTIGVGVSIFAVSKAVSTLNAYLDDQPAEFTLPAPTEAEATKASEKGAALQSAIENGSGGSFSFTDAEINAMIASGLEKQGATKIKVRVTLAGGEAKGEISIPVEELFPQAKDKHLNGEATFSVVKANKPDRLQVKIKDLKVKGEPIPENIMKTLRTVNLMDDLYTNPQNHEAREILESIDTITVEDDRIVFKVAESATGSEKPPESERANPAPDAP